MTTFNDFIVECYKRSVPSVDLNEVSADNPVDCTKHTLSVAIYEALVNEFSQGDMDKFSACNMWCLLSGPRLVND